MSETKFCCWNFPTANKGGESGGKKRPYPGTSVGPSGGRPLLYGPDSKSSAKERARRRDATKIYLLESYVDWQLQKDIYQQVNGITATNADFAEHLLKDHGERCKLEIIKKDVETQTDEVLAAGSSERQDYSLLSASTPVKKSSAVLWPEGSPVPPVVPVGYTKETPNQKDALNIPNQEQQKVTGYWSDEEEEDKFGEWDDAMAELNQSKILLNELENSISVDEEVFGCGPTEDTSEEIVAGHPHQSEKNLESLIQSCVTEEKAIVWVSKIEELLKQIHGDTCPDPSCGRMLVYKNTFTGSGFKVSWECHQGHRSGEWFSQPLFNKMYAGNLLISAGIILSGNVILKMSHFFNTVGLKSISKDTFYRTQRLYVAPVVDTFWKGMQRGILSSYGDQGVVVAGDGRCDSPGHSAQYCGYVFTDESSKNVLHVEVVDVREVGGKSPNMEKLAFERGMDFLMKEITVAELVTNAHTQISATMRNSPKFKEVVHQHDVWHGSKSIVRKMKKESRSGENRALQSWLPSIRNHFWFSSKDCHGDESRMKATFLGILHHIVDEHKWVFGTDGRPGMCTHEELQEAEQSVGYRKGLCHTRP